MLSCWAFHMKFAGHLSDFKQWRGSSWGSHNFCMSVVPVYYFVTLNRIYRHWYGEDIRILKRSAGMLEGSR